MVGDTLVDGTNFLLNTDQGAKSTLPERSICLSTQSILTRNWTFEQDPKYPIRLLVDIAIKALSPAAINDPTTAVQTIDQIEDLLRRLGRNDLDIGTSRTRGFSGWSSGPDVGRLSRPRVRRDPAIRHRFGASHAPTTIRALCYRIADIGDAIAISQTIFSILNSLIERSPFDIEDRIVARQEGPQGIGLSLQACSVEEPANCYVKTHAHVGANDL